MNAKSLIKIAAVAVVAMAIVYRVEPVRKVVVGA